MADNKFTPTTGQVRLLYVARREDADMQERATAYAEFDRWLLAHDTATRAEQREQDARTAEHTTVVVTDGIGVIRAKVAAAIRATADERAISAPEPIDQRYAVAMDANDDFVLNDGTVMDRKAFYPYSDVPRPALWTGTPTAPVDRLAVIREVIEYALEDLGDEGLAHTLAEHFSVAPTGEEVTQ